MSTARNTLLFGAALTVSTAAIAVDHVVNPVPRVEQAAAVAIGGAAPCAAGAPVAAPCAAGAPIAAPCAAGAPALAAPPPPPAPMPQDEAAEPETALRPPPPPPAPMPDDQ